MEAPISRTFHVNKFYKISVSEFIAIRDYRSIFCGLPSARGMDEFLMLPRLLSSVTTVDEADKIEWKWDGGTKFSMKKSYSFFSHGGVTHLFAKINWKLAVPEKLKMSNRLLHNNKILKVDNLRKRNFLAPIVCPLCCVEEETANHLSRISGN